jgi:uncharacterized protein YdeI (YjbR/CyaY-like superfamily)
MNSIFDRDLWKHPCKIIFLRNMKINEPSIYLPTRQAWREWLAKHHQSETVIWLIHYKKHTGKPSVAYNDAVEEALCFGWVDSLIQRMDGDRYRQKYTPRKPRSTWSGHNVRRVEKMIAEGKMMEPGIELYRFAKENGLLPPAKKPRQKEGIFPEVPRFFTEALKANPEAEKAFNVLAPSYKLRYLGWIMAAKKEETRLRRMNEALELLAAGRQLGMK